MPRYCFDFGNSDKGPIGGMARIDGPCPEDALETLKELFESIARSARGCLDAAKGSDHPDIEYVNVSFNADALSLDNLIESETEDENDDDDEGDTDTSL